MWDWHLGSKLCLLLRQQVDDDGLASFACGFMPRTWRLRKVSILIARSQYFSRLMVLVIALNAAFLAMWDPLAVLYNIPSVRNDLVQSSELFFQIAYTVEMIVVMMAFGIYWEAKTAYFRSTWRIFDFLVVILGWIALIVEIASSSGSSPLLRVIRVLRPLRGLQYIPGLTVLNNTIVRSVEQLGDVLLFLLFTYFVLSVIGLTVFRGKLHQRCGWQSSTNDQWNLYGPTADRFCSVTFIGGFRCPSVNVIESGTGLLRPVICAQQFEPPNSGLTGFDNIFQSMLTVFVMATLEGWSDVMYWYNDATNEWSQLFFLAVILFGSLIVLSLITAVLTINYTAEREKVHLKRSLELKKRQLTELARITEQRHKTLQRARRTFVADLELRLIYSYEMYGDTPGYKTVTKAMYERYVAKHTPEEVSDFRNRVAKAMLRRRKTLHPEGELHLFSSTGEKVMYEDGKDSEVADGSEGSLGDIVQNSLAADFIEDVPEFVPQSVFSGEPLIKSKRFPYEDQYGVPWGEDRDCNIAVSVSYRIVMAQIFQSFIWFCIIINTVLLGYDHFLQPPESIFISDIFNKVLTAIYTVEAVLKLLGLGPRYYFNDRFNMFDLFVVVVSWIEIVINLLVSPGSGGTAATSVFRVFRLLRVLRLAHIWGSLKTLLRTIIRTFRGVYPFTVMLTVFLYIFTVSGLMIFGGVLVIPPSVVDPVSGESVPNPEFDCTRLYGNFYFGNISHCPERANYDSLLWSFVTSFQLLTKENWNEVMYSAAAAVGSWVPAIYFVLVILVGPFLVLNLFLAILIDSFMEVHDDERIIRKEYLEKRRKLKEEKTRRRKQRKVDRQKQRDPKKLSSVPGSEDGGENALKRTDSALSVATSGMISQQGSSEDDLKAWVNARLLTLEKEKANEPFLDNPAFRYRSLFLIAPSNPVRIICAVIAESAAFQVFSFALIILSCVELVLDVPLAPGQAPVESSLKMDVLGSLNIFCVSVFVLEMVMKVLAYGFVLHPGAYLRDSWNVLDFLVVVFSVVDLALLNQPGLNVVKAVRAFRPLKLVRHIEGMRVVVASVIRAVVPVSQIALVALMFYFIFAVVATTLFGGKTEGCYVCNQTDGTCVRPPVNVTTGYLSVSRTCFPYRTYGVTDCSPFQQCVGGYSVQNDASHLEGSLSWRNPQYDYSGAEFSFDNVLVSMLVLYEASTLELWPQTMQSSTDMTGIGHSPVRGASDVNSLFFVVFLFFTNFFLLQLFVASVVDSFSETDMRYSGKAFMTDAQFEWLQMQHKVHKMTFGRRVVPPTRTWRRRIFNMVTSTPFDLAILGIIVLNTILLASEHFSMTPSYQTFLQVADYVFGAIYILEMMLKIVGLGNQYFRLYWFDFFIVVTLVLTWVLESTDIGDFFEVFEVFRILRIGRIMQRFNGVSNLIATLAYSIPALLNILMLVLLIFFVYTIFGIQLFGYIPSSPATAARMHFLNEYANFQDFVSAFMTLFRMATGESWNGIMRDLAVESAAAWPFCVSFILLVQFVFLNLFVAIVLGNFNAVLTKTKKEVISKKTLVNFVHLWQEQVDSFEIQVQHRLASTIDTARQDQPPDDAISRKVSGLIASSFPRPTQMKTSTRNDERCARLARTVMDPNYLPASSFPGFFVGLSPPLGLPLSRSLSPSDMMRFIRIAKIPVTKTGMINARTTLAALIDHALGTESDDEAYSLLHSALRIRMKSDAKSTAEHSKSMTEKATTHSVAEEIATRRLQVTARYLLARERVKRLTEDGVYSAEKGAEIIQQLSLQYSRDVVSGLLNVELFAQNN